MTKPKPWDEYEIKARYIPCLLSVIPLVHFFVVLLGNAFWKDLVGNFSWLLVVANLSISLVVMIALIQIQTGIAKHWVEENVFGQGGKCFPTTDMLLLKGGLISQERKNILRNKISERFNFTFSNYEEEINDSENSRLQAREAVSAVRRDVGKGLMTYQYNIRYGFFRNLIGGVAWAVFGSLGCTAIYGIEHDWKAMGFFAGIAITFLFIFIFKKSILTKLAFAYADTLFNDFLIK